MSDHDLTERPHASAGTDTDGTPTGSARVATESGRRRTASGNGSPASPRRRQILKSLSVVPLAAALSGCQFGADTGAATRSDLAPGESTRFADALRFERSYGVEMAVRAADGPTTTTIGRFHGRDHYLRHDRDGNVIESALVDGDGYVVDGECVTHPDLTDGIEGPRDGVAERRRDGVSDPELTVTGTTSIDDREAYVLALPAGSVEGHASDLTYYVDAETRYLRRLETAATVVEYHSWGDVDPIDLAELGCE